MERIKPTGSWKKLDDHFLRAINDPWYKCLVNLENLISEYTFLFYIIFRYISFIIHITK